MIVLQIILWIMLIVVVVGVATLVVGLVQRKGSSYKPYGPYESFIKRPLDAFLSFGSLVVLSPILMIIAILIRIKLGSPVIYSQDRPGRDEKVFKLYKFRTMTNQTDENGNPLPDEVRLTSFGKKLRATSLDELPELLNIIKGDMAVVGPRPLLVKYLPWYTEEQHKRHDVRPGLTGYAQAHGRNAVDWDDKFQMDVNYVKHITFRGDCRIILDTVKAVLKHDGINSDTSATMEDFVDYCIQKGRKPSDGSSLPVESESMDLTTGE